MTLWIEQVCGTFMRKHIDHRPWKVTIDMRVQTCWLFYNVLSGCTNSELSVFM